MKSNILIIDDDITLCELLQLLYINNGFDCTYCTKATEAVILLDYIAFDALIVDYMMPNMNGIDFLTTIKAKNINIPSIMLTAVDDIDNKILALTNYSNDYVAKPFNSKELIARTNNIIKQNKVSMLSSIIQVGNIIYNKVNKSVLIDGNTINLSTQESDILDIFINNLNNTIEKEDILQYLGKTISETNLNSLNVMILRLRKKIDPNGLYLRTIRGKGFILTGY